MMCSVVLYVEAGLIALFHVSPEMSYERGNGRGWWIRMEREKSWSSGAEVRCV